MSTARVASIHFAPLVADRGIYGGYYKIPAVALGAKPEIIECVDKLQRDEGPVSSGPGGGKRQLLRYHVDGQDIAKDIVREWSQNGVGMTPEAKPGVWVVRDRMPIMTKDERGEEVYVLDHFGALTFREATPAEAKANWDEDLANAYRVDRAYAEWCYVDGNRIAADARVIQFIPRNYKRAARQYGLEADWLKEGAALEVVPCISCTKVISKRAIVCPYCQQVNDNVRYAEMQISREAALRDAKKQAAA